MLGRVAIMMGMLVGCGGSTPKAQPPKTSSVMRADLPAEIRDFVPAHGIYVAGGGTKSTVFRVIIDTDAHTIYTGTAPAGSPLHGKLVEEHTRPLTPANEKHLLELSEDAWLDDPSSGPHSHVDGYDELLVIPDFDDQAKVLFFHEQGPIQQPKAKEVLDQARAAAAL